MSALAPAERAEWTAAPCTVHVIRDVVEWSTLEPEWRALFAASPAASPPLRWEWLWEWWRLYGPVYGLSGRGLRIFTIRRGGRLIGALPLYLGSRGRSPLASRRLGFLSTGESACEETCAEYLDLLSLPGEEQACLDALEIALADPREGAWDELELSSLSYRSVLCSGCGRFGGSRAHVSVSEEGTCSVADLTGGFESYLHRLSRHGRKHARQLLREVEADGMVLEIAASEREAELFFGQMVQLHQRRWTGAGEPGCFAAPRFTRFHQTLCRLLVPNGGALLARLSAAGEPLAVLYGFLTRDKFDYYQSGIVRHGQGRVASPGTAAHLLLMARLARQGITSYDFLAGLNHQKRSLATETHALVRLRVLRPTLRTAASQASDRIARTAARSRRIPARWSKC